jgi:hypothetical protein
MVSLSSSFSAVQYLLAPATLPKSLLLAGGRCPPSQPPPSLLSSTSDPSASVSVSTVAAKDDDDDDAQPKQQPQEPFCLSVLSYNVLLPNSVDGWWNYKMYLPPLTDRSMAEWPYRRNLLQERIQLIGTSFITPATLCLSLSLVFFVSLIIHTFHSTFFTALFLLLLKFLFHYIAEITHADADVVCLQEVAPRSFEDDFAFMKDLGYDEHEMFKKGRFRPATFWKSSRLSLVTPPVHKDRTLLTIFEPVVPVPVAVSTAVDNNKESTGDEDSFRQQHPEKKGKQGKGQHQPHQRYWYILNCHLQAGGQAQRRLRQIMEGIKAVVTAAKKLKGKARGFSVDDGNMNVA